MFLDWIQMGLKPWFECEHRKEIDLKIIFGHWSTLGFYHDKFPNVLGNDEDHVHFLIQAVQIGVKSITAREIFSRNQEIKKVLWGGSLWTSGFYANTVGQYGSKDSNYNQGKKYNKVSRLF